MDTFVLVVSAAGAFAFGTVIGWISYRTLRRKGQAAISDLATVVGAVGGATVTGTFHSESGAFGFYCLGLFVGFFGYLAYAREVEASTNPKDVALAPWLEERSPNPAPVPPPAHVQLKKPPPDPDPAPDDPKKDPKA